MKNTFGRLRYDETSRENLFYTSRNFSFHPFICPLAVLLCNIMGKTLTNVRRCANATSFTRFLSGGNYFFQKNKIRSRKNARIDINTIYNTKRVSAVLFFYCFFWTMRGEGGWLKIIIKCGLRWRRPRTLLLMMVMMMTMTLNHKTTDPPRYALLSPAHMAMLRVNEQN